jgi:hypothetical protein
VPTYAVDWKTARVRLTEGAESRFISNRRVTCTRIHTHCERRHGDFCSHEIERRNGHLEGRVPIVVVIHRIRPHEKLSAFDTDPVQFYAWAGVERLRHRVYGHDAGILDIRGSRDVNRHASV